MNPFDAAIAFFITHKIILIPIVVVIWVVSLCFPKKNKHQRKIGTADFVLKRISEFSAPQKIAYLRKIDPYSFEELILTCLERKGFPIKRNERYSNDGGIDGRFFVDGEVYLIQAKRYQKEIRYDHLEDFANILEKNKCKGIFVHTGRTPKNITARKINMDNITIISGNRLLELLNTELKLKF